MKAVIYKKANGQILRMVDVPADHVQAQCQTGEEFYLNSPPDATHIIDGEPVAVAPLAPSTGELLQRVRRERNRLLSLSDWTQVSDAPLTYEQKNAWRVYRQELRDLPGCCDPAAVVWPVCR